jgi:hypothetical protein
MGVFGSYIGIASGGDFGFSIGVLGLSKGV